MANKRPTLNVGNTTKDSRVTNNLLCEGAINVTDEGTSDVTIGDRVKNVDSKDITFASNITYSTSGKNNIEDAVPSTSDGRGAVFAGPTNIGSTIHHITAENVHNETTVIVNSDKHPSPDTYLFQVNEPETSFTGRSKELDRLHQFYSVNAKNIGVLYGIGGVGKTQLAREFIKRNRDLYSNFIWIRSGEGTSIEQSFAVLSKELRLPLKDADGDRLESESVIARVLERLCKRKTLFVYDNVDNPQSTDYLKSILGKALTVDADNLHVLITSQHQEWPPEFERFPLNVWDKTESVEYISNILYGCGNDTVDDKESLAKTLQYFPLALRQATAYIRVQRRRNPKFKISEFIRKFNRKTREMLRDESFKKQMITVYERTTYTTWRIASNEIKKDEVNGALAMRILNIIAFCGEDWIKREIFYFVANGQVNQFKDEESEEFEDWKEAVDSAVELLTTYCMVDRVDYWIYNDSHLSIHRLIQKVTKLLLEDSNEVETSLRDALQLLTNLAATDRGDVWYDIRTHIVPIFDSVFSSSVKEILVKDFSSLPVIIVRDTERALTHSSGMKIADKFLVPMTNILGPENRHVLKIRYYVVRSTFRNYSYPSKPHVDLLEIFEKQKIFLSEVDPDTLETQCQIICSYIDHEDLEEAVSWLKHNNCKGDIFGDVISTFEKYKNNCQITLPLYQSILRVQKSLLGEGHYDTISTLRKIVDAQREQGNSELSFKWHKELFEVECRCRPNRDKLEILAKFLNIADSYSEYRLPNDYSALRMSQFIFTQKRNLQGDTDSGIFKTLLSIACEHHQLENYNASARLFESALEIRREVYYGTSGIMYKIILKKQMALFGESHPTTVRVMHEIASTYIDLEVIDNAFEWYQKAIDIQRKSSSEGHSYTVKAMYAIARTHVRFKSNDKALDQYRNALDKLIEIKTDMYMVHYDIAEEVNFHRNKENYELALSLLEIIFEKEKGVLGADHYLTLHTLSKKDSIQNLIAERHPADALKLFQVELEKQKERFSGSYCDTLKTMRRIADAYIKLKDYQCALRIFEDLLKKYKVLSSEIIDDPTIHDTSIEESIGDASTDESFNNTSIGDSSIDDPNNDNTVEIQCLIARTHGYLTSNDAALEKYRNILDKLIERAESMDEIDWRIIDNEARFFSENESYNLALGLYNIIFEKKKKNLGADHYETLHTLGKKRRILNLIAERHPADALKLFLVEFYKQKESLGESHCDTLKTMRRIADAHFKLKDYQCALRMYEDLLEKHKVVSSESIADPSIDDPSIEESIGGSSIDDPNIDTVEIQCLIARTHGYLTSNDAALEMYRNILDKLIERAESMDEIDWHLMENEVKFLCKDKSYNLALGLNNIIFEEKKNKLGEDHYKTLHTSAMIAYMQNLQTILTESSSNAQDELQRQIENLVENQPNSRGEREEHQRETMWNLLRTCRKRQNYEDAIFTYGNELEIANQRLVDTTDIWTKFYDEASFQFDVKNYELALRFYELLLEKQMFWFDVDYSFTLKTMHEIALIQAKLKRYDQALNMYQVVFDTRKTSLGDFYPDTLETMSQLAHLHKEHGNRSDAVQLYRQLYAILKYLKGNEHPEALSAFQLGELEERDVSMDYLPDSLKEEFEFTERHRKLRATK